ncbi:UNVERIFIED_CONTAM: Ubiquitin carboxyl-terminal hydrolase 33 [Siphonaria sp. JEL0065]|nr:Ubiquitin carboxyl-terminal hydrolase 33 [Siphonaria sp. JEL0065]
MEDLSPHPEAGKEAGSGRRRGSVGLEQLPVEVVEHLAFMFLDPASALRLSHGSARLFSALGAPRLWRGLAAHWSGINYLAADNYPNPKRRCFDQPLLDACCPHLSALNDQTTTEDRAKRYQEYVSQQPMRCTHSPCEFGPQDIWFCLAENCDSVGCSRSKNKHALKHNEATGHLMTVRVTTLEVWCYDCVKWVGNPQMPLIEQITTRNIINKLLDCSTEPFLSLQKEAALRDRRFRERDVYNLEESDKIFFLSIRFLTEWSLFLMDSVDGPKGIRNDDLVLKMDEVTGLAIMKPDVVPHRDFGIVSEESWKYLLATYGGFGPPLSLDNIPQFDPAYETLRNSVASSKATIVAQCRENRAKLIPGTGRPRGENYILKSSLYKLIESQTRMTHPILNTGVPNGTTRRRRSSVDEYLSKKRSILDLAPEIIFMMAYDFLDASSVLVLTKTSTKLRYILNTSQYLWAKLTYDKHGINYIEQGGNWRTACFDPEFYDLCCPHLSTISAAVTQERTQFYQDQLDSTDFNALTCTHRTCKVGPPDLWMCLSPNCQSLACGRSRKQHAIHHASTTSHSLSLKINNLEVWCYSCIKWVGNPYQPLAEQQKLNQITSQLLAPPREPFRSLQLQVSWNPRRIEERMMHIVEEGDKLYFLSREFLHDWTRFLVGDGDPPVTIDNSFLWTGEVEAKTGKPLMVPTLVPHYDFGIISEASWMKLVAQYGGGPAISEDSIPADDPLYDSLRREVEEAKAGIIENCQSDVPAVGANGGAGGGATVQAIVE